MKHSDYKRVCSRMTTTQIVQARNAEQRLLMEDALRSRSNSEQEVSYVLADKIGPLEIYNRVINGIVTGQVRRRVW